MKRYQQTYAMAFDDRETKSAHLGRLLHEGLAHHQAGSLSEAIKRYESVLKLSPEQPDALNLLGAAEMTLGNFERAIALTEKAVRFEPKNFSALTNLGNARLAVGDIKGAISAYRLGIVVKPDSADLQYNLANALRQAGREDEALTHFDAAVALNPLKADAWFNRGNLLAARELYSEAVQSFQTAFQQNPSIPSLLVNWGCSLAALKRVNEAEALFRKAIQIDSEDHGAYHNLGSLMLRSERVSEAMELAETAVRLKPDEIVYRHNLITPWLEIDKERAYEIATETLEMDRSCAKSWWMMGIVEMGKLRPKHAIIAFEKAYELEPEGFKDNNNLGLAYSAASELDKAIEFYGHALKQRPEDAEAWADVAISQMNGGQIPTAVESLRHALRLDPSLQYAHSNLLMILCYSPDYDNHQLLQEAKDWANEHTPLSMVLPTKVRPRGEKLRIGYVSPDFHDHPAGRVYERLFRYHDRSRYDVTIYCNNEKADEVTKRTVESVDRWRLVQNMSDLSLANQIRADEIDVLVDLVGHTPNHRLKVFGHKPATVQVTWLGYFATTGMQQMDYILADDHLVPPELEEFFTEKIAKMPGSFYVFNQPNFEVPLTPVPAISNGFITYGSLNNTAKITPEVVELWSRVMAQTPDSRMFLNRWPYQSELVRNYFRGLFEKNGIAGERIEFAHTFTRREYFDSYAKVDIMLDSFPFGAGTTTSEAVWMGVPVVSLTTDRFAGRQTKSIYHQVGLEDMLPESKEEFLELALKLSQDLPYLTKFRTEMRTVAENSPLMDFPRYARELEQTFEWMYREVACSL